MYKGNQTWTLNNSRLKSIFPNEFFPCTILLNFRLSSKSFIFSSCPSFFTHFRSKEIEWNESNKILAKKIPSFCSLVAREDVNKSDRPYFWTILCCFLFLFRSFEDDMVASNMKWWMNDYVMIDDNDVGICWNEKEEGILKKIRNRLE